MRLAVELHGTRVGTLEGDARTFDFIPDPEAIDRFGPNSTVVSVTIPLSSQPRRNHAGKRRNWFAELLPEGDQYSYMLQQGGLRSGDVPGFLARYGRDVAGALQIWDIDDPTEPQTPDLRPLTEQDVRELLEDPLGSPLANAPHAGRSSLGGVQPKVVLTRIDDSWAQALGGYPTTHILKPQLPGAHSTVIFDEEYGSRVARRLGLATFATSIEHFAGLSTLVIERYDRNGEHRIHQEDFNQVLGASGNEKYQEIGGVVSLRRIADALQRHGTDRDLRKLGEQTVLAAGLGNLDMHTKNIGLLHDELGGVTLAPAYDVVPQSQLPSDGKLALAVNKRYGLGEITAEDLVAEFSSWGLRRPRRIVEDTLERLAAIVDAEFPLKGAHPALHEHVSAIIRNLLDGRPALSER